MKGSGKLYYLFISAVFANNLYQDLVTSKERDGSESEKSSNYVANFLFIFFQKTCMG